MEETAHHQLDMAIELSGDPDRYIGHVSPAYQNMVGPFGGVTAATILQSVLIHPERVGSPISLTVNYLGPIKEGELVIRPKLLRANRSNQHWMVELLQDEDIYASATCVFAERKDTWAGEEIAFPEVGSPELNAPLAELPMLPKWVKQYEMRFVNGNPFDLEKKDNRENLSESLVWMADKPKRNIDFVSLTALADAFFPRFIVRNRKFVPCGTVSMTIHFHALEEDLAELTSTKVLGRARASKFSGSYFDQTGELWGENKKLLATTSQMVYYKG